MATSSKKRGLYSDIIGLENSNEYSNVSINKTLLISHSKIPNSTNYVNSNIYIRDNSNTYNTNNQDVYVPVSVKDSVMYFNNNTVLDSNNLISEINSAYYPESSDSALKTSNIMVLGNTTGTSPFGYINFATVSPQKQGELGEGLRYNTDSGGVLEFKNRGGAWTALTDGVVSASTLVDLSDTSISSLANNQLLVYKTSNSKWNNTTSIGGLTMTDTLVISSSNVQLTTNKGIIDTNDKNFLTFQTSGATARNYFHITSANSGNGATFSSVGEDTNIDMNLQSKGSGSIVLTTDASFGADVSMTCSNVDINGNVNISGFNIASFIVHPNGSTPTWNTGAGNAISISYNADTIVFSMRNKGAGTYYATLSSVGAVSGQKLNIIYENDDDAVILYVDFGANKLGSGGGLARYLKFTDKGQSSCLIYIGTINDGSSNEVNRWQILNTGCIIE